MRFLAAVLALGLPVLYAQTSPSGRAPRQGGSHAGSAETLALPVLRVSVTGNEMVPAAVVLRMAGIKVGDLASKDAFETARQRLVDTGFFDSVGYRYSPEAKPRAGYVAQFEVHEVKPFYPVKFAGWPGKEKEITAYLQARDPLFLGSAPPTKQVIDHWARLLDAWTAAENHPKKVIGKLISVGTDDYVIQFQPDEPLPAVARVEFTGSQAIPEPELQKSIGMVAYGLPYTEQNFRDLLNSQLKPLYEARGYLRVRFEDISAEPVPPPVKGLLVHVKIVEGPVFKFGKIRVRGVNEDERDAFLHLASIKPGTTANFDQVNTAAEKMQKSAVHAGYNQARVEPQRDIDDAAKTVSVTFQVSRGEEYTFRHLTIQGLDLEGENAIRKMWAEKPGDPFNPDYPNRFLKEVRDAGMFDYLGSTKAEVKTDEQSHTADVTLVFNAEKPEDREQRKKKLQEERNRRS